MNSLERTAVIYEFETYLKSRYASVRKEVPFKKVMLTKRNFRADYLAGNSIIEINGGQWVKGRHNRGGKGYETDLTKMNLAQAAGFKYYQFTYEMLARLQYKNYL